MIAETANCDDTAGMARSWDYPRWRRILMQVTLCVILAGTIGLSAVVTKYRSSVPFAGPRSFGQLRANLPAGWLFQRRNDRPVVVEARETSGEREGRVMLLRVEQKAPGLSAEEYLNDSGLVKDTVEAAGINEVIPIVIADTRGVLYERQRVVEIDPSVPAEYHPVWFAAGVLPSGMAVSIELDCPAEIDPAADKMLIEKTAAQLHFVDNP